MSQIEANSLSLGQVRDVINGRLVLGEQKEIQEVKNAYAAYESLSEINPYSIKDLKKFHGIMTKYLVEECGEFRHGEEGVFNGDECIFMAPSAQFVPQLMDELFEWMKKSRNSVHPLIMSSVFHYEFVFIHPFADGNGRMARLWHTAILAKWKHVFEFIPIESRIEKFQDEYGKKNDKHIDTDDSTDQNQHIGKYLQQMVRLIDSSVNLCLKRQNQDQSQCDHRRRKCDPEVFPEFIFHLAALSVTGCDCCIGNKGKIVPEHCTTHDRSDTKRKIKPGCSRYRCLFPAILPQDALYWKRC